MHTPSQKILTRAGLLLALIVLSPPAAHAAPLTDGPLGAEGAVMQGEMHSYFAGEKAGGIWLMGVGAPAIAVGTGLLFHQGEFYRGLAYPVLAIGVMEVLGGLAFYLNSNRRVPRFNQQLRKNPTEFRSGELTRMHRVNRELSFLTAVELTLMVAGGTMTGVGALRGLDTLAGVGTGLLLQSTVLFIYDQLAARRALRYTDGLTRFNVGMVAGPGGPGAVVSPPRGAMLTMQRMF